MKQQIKAVGAKIKRFNCRFNQYQENWIFVNNQARFSQQLNNEEENHQCEIKNSVEAQKRHKDVEWLKDVKKELEQDKGQNKIDTTIGKMMRVLRKIPNWKAPSPDNVQGYWLKNLTPLNDKSVMHLQDCLNSGVVPDLLTNGRTVLIQKDKIKKNIASNYQPITCLHLV